MGAEKHWSSRAEVLTLVRLAGVPVLLMTWDGTPAQDPGLDRYNDLPSAM